MQTINRKEETLLTSEQNTSSFLIKELISSSSVLLFKQPEKILSYRSENLIPCFSLANIEKISQDYRYNLNEQNQYDAESTQKLENRIPELENRIPEKNLFQQANLLPKKKKLSQVITSREFHEIINCIKENSYIGARKRVALVLLYLTGLRVSNLLLFNVNKLNSLIKTGLTDLQITKNTSYQHPIQIDSNALNFLKKFEKDINILLEKKSLLNPVFTSSSVLTKALSRETLNKELNKVLEKASRSLGKNLKTHSLRASFITDLLKTTSIDEVQEFVGHSNINTTLLYKRTRLNNKEIHRVAENLSTVRPELLNNKEIHRVAENLSTVHPEPLSAYG